MLENTLAYIMKICTRSHKEIITNVMLMKLFVLCSILKKSHLIYQVFQSHILEQDFHKWTQSLVPLKKCFNYIIL